MIKLDSDIMGIIMALLTFLIPVISAIFEKNRKKKKGSAEDVLPDEEPFSDQSITKETQKGSDIEEMFNRLLGLELPEEGVETPLEEDIPVHEEPEVKHEPVVAPPHDDVPDEAVPSTFQAAVAEQESKDGEISGEHNNGKNSLRKRLKENPADMVLFAEIMKPKYKEL